MTEVPAWGTPSTAGGPTPEHRSEHRLQESAGYVLLVEQLIGSGDAAAWRVAPEPIPAGAMREHARAAALKLARSFQPQHPMSPRARTVFRVNDDTLVVLVQGMTKTYHFRISVAEQLR
jgi:hypothetical protein